MSPEETLQQNNELLTRLISVLLQGSTTDPGIPDSPHEKPADAEPVVTEPQVTPSDGDETPEAVFEEARSLILALAKTNLTEGVRILALFGAKKLHEVPPDRLPELIAAIKKVPEREYA